MGRYRTSSLLGTVMLLAMAATSGWAQEGTGSLTGKLTDLHSKPLGGASMVARNVATGAEARTITSKNGNYQFSGLEPGEYAIEAKAADLRRGRLEGIVVAAGREARVQAAMDLVPAVDVDAARSWRSRKGRKSRLGIRLRLPMPCAFWSGRAWGPRTRSRASEKKSKAQ